jgi:hypothetical protein
VFLAVRPDVEGNISMRCPYECGFAGTPAEVEGHVIYLGQFDDPGHEPADQVLTPTARQGNFIFSTPTGQPEARTP